MIKNNHSHNIHSFQIEATKFDPDRILEISGPILMTSKPQESPFAIDVCWFGPTGFI